jgi:hypothetical protein
MIVESCCWTPTKTALWVSIDFFYSASRSLLPLHRTVRTSSVVVGCGGGATRTSPLDLRDCLLKQSFLRMPSLARRSVL